jgi:DNA-binding XRE family transcriptional regulator
MSHRAKQTAELKAREEHSITQRLACNLVGVDRETVRREPTTDDLEVCVRCAR